MTKSKSEECSRREFIDLVGVSLGAVALAGIGCGSDKAGGANQAGAGGTGAGGGAGSTGGAGATTQGGASAGGAGATTGGAVSGTTGGTSGTAATSNLVGLARSANGTQSAKDAIAAAGGLPDLTGRTVVIKLNLLQNAGPPCTTSAAVVVGVVQAVKAKGAAKIIVGDCSMGVGAIAVMAGTSGIHAALVAEGGVTEVDFSANGAADLVQLKPSGAAQWPNGFNVWKALVDDGTGKAPYIINMPCCKHHGMATWSLVMKNWIGLLPHGEVNGASSSAVADDRAEAHGVLTAGLPELHLGVKEDFVVLDAMRAQLTGGPGNGAANTQGSPGIVVASADAVAVEATGLCILREYRSRMATVPARDAIETVAIFNTNTSTLMGRALTLGNGWITSRAQYRYVAVGLGADEALIMARLDS